MLVLSLGISTLLNYIAIYQPFVFSRNIVPISDSTTKKWAFICVLTLSFCWIYYWYSFQEIQNYNLMIYVVLIQIAMVDAYSKNIPNRLVLLLLIIVSIDVVQLIEESNWIFICLFTFSILAVQVTIKQIVKRTLLGWGDIKFLIALSIIFSNGVLAILFGGIILAGLFSIILVVLNPENRKRHLPLSPFFVAIIPVLSKISINFEKLLLNAV